MKNSAIVLAGACLLALGAPAATVRPAMADSASGPFADVPADHWAYQSVDTLQKAGIVIGYPDGTYGGKRAMTRYEFATAIARLLPLLNPTGAGNYATKDDLSALNQDIQGKLQANQDALDALRKLVDEFTPELQGLGQDVAAAKDRLDALEARVAAIEEEQRRIRFTGALNLIAEGDNVTKGSAFIDGNGNAEGINKHLLQTTDVYNDFLLSIHGRVDDNTTANVKLDFGNYLSAVGNTAAPGFSAGSVAATALTPGTLNATNQQTTVWEANVTTGAKLGRIGGAGVTIGRFGNQWTPYTLKQVDADVYTQLIQTDSGDIPTDGGKFDLPNGRLDVDGWAGQMKAIPFAEPWGGPVASTLHGQLDARPAGFLPTTHASALFQGDGVRATYGHPDTGQIGASLENFATTGFVVDPNNGDKYSLLNVYGADYTGLFPVIKSGIQLTASYTDAAVSSSSRAFNNTGNNWRYSALDTQVGRQFGPLWLQGGYQYVGPEFTAPGDWGRAASWIDPTNVEGGVGSATLALGKNLTLSGDVKAYQAAYGAEQDGGLINSPLQQGDKVTNYKVGADYTCVGGYDTMVSFEQSSYDLKDNENTLTRAGKPADNLLTIGIGHTMSKNATVHLIYQYDSYSDRNTGFGAGDSAGNVVATQVTAKF